MTNNPNAFVSVPREPTEEMRAAGRVAWMNRNLADPASEPIRDCYKAMLAAAPSAPVAGEDELRKALERAISEYVTLKIAATAAVNLLDNNTAPPSAVVEILRAALTSTDGDKG